MLPTIEWNDEGVVMIDQRKLPGAEIYVTCKTRKGRREGDQDDGDSRRAGDRRGGGDGAGARRAAEQGDRNDEARRRVLQAVRDDGGRRGRRPSICSGRSIG